jgi:uncharacterized protein (DUF4415 family)
MTASKQNSPNTSDWKDPDDAPELTEDFFKRVEIRDNEKLVRRGRPPLAATKKPVSLRLDADVLAHFRASGPGWQGRINDALRRSMARKGLK